MASSILHRATGAALALGGLWLAWWLIAAASGPDAFATAQAFAGSLIGRALLLGFTWALMFHLLNGIRHLVWDTGRGFDLRTSTMSGWLVVAGSIILTLLVWVLGYAAMGS